MMMGQSKRGQFTAISNNRIALVASNLVSHWFWKDGQHKRKHGSSVNATEPKYFVRNGTSSSSHNFKPSLKYFSLGFGRISFG
jgi:hypothetical protein